MALAMMPALVLLSMLLIGCDRGDADIAASSQQAQLERLGYIDTGPLLLADDPEFESDTRAALTVVEVPSDTQIEVGAGWVPLPSYFGGVPDMFVLGLSREVEGRRYYMALQLRDLARDSYDAMYFRWPLDAERPALPDDLEEPAVLIQISSGPPWPVGVSPSRNPDGGWHEAVVDMHGHLWLNPARRTVVALDTGEDMSRLKELTWWPVHAAREDLFTSCGGLKGCVVMAKGGMALVPALAGEISCAPSPDGLGWC